MTQTMTEKLTLERTKQRIDRKLQRIERANPDHFRFPRHSDSYHRTLPFADRRDAAELKDALIGTVVFFAFIGALIFLPAVMA